jgi:hypothetical protein
MGAGDWSPTTTRPVCRINRDSLSLKGPLNDLQEWRAARDANSRLSGQDKSILRSFQLRSCRKQAWVLKKGCSEAEVGGGVGTTVRKSFLRGLETKPSRRAAVGALG